MKKFLLKDDKNALIFSFNSSENFSTTESYLVKKKKLN